MRVLFLGGTGVISSACADLAVARGLDLFVLTRGASARPVPEGTTALHGDARDPVSVRAAIGDRTFDAVVDWVAFEPDHVEVDLETFRGRTGQFVFVSSASVYAKPVPSLPLVESTPLRNPFWAYARAKIACEDRLVRAYRAEGFPVTIVRPSHTYDRTLIPFRGRYTFVDRMRRGLPVVVHGDGTSLWTLTHARDFAVGLVGLLGLPRALGEAYHITSDEALPWDAIAHALGRAAGVEPRIVHAPSDLIAAYDADWGASLLGDKAHSAVFDTTKLRRAVPDFRPTTSWARGAEEIVAWVDADPARRAVDAAFDALTDRIVAAMEAARP